MNNQPAAGSSVWRFEFRGTTAEYFRIWLANTLLSIITLGIYSAWAKVRNRRYLYGNAFVNGINFDYVANPVSILVARVIVILFVGGGAILFGDDALQNAIHISLIYLLLPWALVRGLAFNARYSIYRRTRFRFRKRMGSAYLLFAPFLMGLFGFVYVSSYLQWSIINVDYLPAPPDYEILIRLAGLFSLLLLACTPWLIRGWHKFKASNHSLGPIQFQFEKPAISGYLLALWVIPIVVYVIFVATGVVVTMLFSPSSPSNILLVSILASMLGVVVILSLSGAKLFQLYWNQLRCSVGEESGRFHAQLSLFGFGIKILFVNFIATFFSLGLLYPWAAIRRARYIAEHVSLEAPASALSNIPAMLDEDESALGEEIHELEGFDFDVGLI